MLVFGSLGINKKTNKKSSASIIVSYYVGLKTIAKWTKEIKKRKKNWTFAYKSKKRLCQACQEFTYFLAGFFKVVFIVVLG